MGTKDKAVGIFIARRKGIVPARPQNRSDKINPVNPQIFLGDIAAQIEGRRLVSRFLRLVRKFQGFLRAEGKKPGQPRAGKNLVVKLQAQIEPAGLVTERLEKGREIGTAGVSRVQLNYWRLENQNVHRRQYSRK